MIEFFKKLSLYIIMKKLSLSQFLSSLPGPNNIPQSQNISKYAQTNKASHLEQGRLAILGLIRQKKQGMLRQNLNIQVLRPCHLGSGTGLNPP